MIDGKNIGSAHIFNYDSSGDLFKNYFQSKMKAFVFKRSNALVGKLDVRDFSEIEKNLKASKFYRHVVPYDYIECSGSVWTVIQADEGLSIREGRLTPQSNPSNKLPPITAETLCQVVQEERKSGPFVRDQIRAMWATGNLTANALILPDGHTEWLPIARFLEAGRDIASNDKTSEYGRRSIGFTLIAIGSSLLLYFVFVYDTSVWVEGQYTRYGYTSGERIVNLSKQQNRTLGALLGMAVGVSGVVLIATSKNKI